MPPPAKSAALQELPDAVTEDILLRLPDAADVGRASLVSTAFHRVASDRRFLRRRQSLYPRPFLGFFHSSEDGAVVEFHRAEPPHRSAPAARAAADAGDFTFSFLPGGLSNPWSRGWRVHDALDGRVLLSRRDAGATFLNLVVCDPLHRRFVQIPPIPGDLVPPTKYITEMDSEPFLAPAAEEEGRKKVDEEDYLRFRVIYNWMSKFKVWSFVFSSHTGRWHGTKSISFLPHRLIEDPRRLARHFVRDRGCFYWARHGVYYLLVLNLSVMEFSVVDLPHAGNTSMGLIIAGGGDRLRLLSLYNNGRRVDVYSKMTWPEDGGSSGAEEWRHDKVITLPDSNYSYNIIATAEGYSLLQGKSVPFIPLQSQYLTLDHKTLLVERLCVLDNTRYWDPCPLLLNHLYASFPPSLSVPSL
ncbi:unnamed protein product [Urochloa humidicola]